MTAFRYMIHAGIGEIHMNNILSTIYIPPVCHKTVKLESLNKSVVLVAHNCHIFDMHVLANALMREGLRSDFEVWVQGFAEFFPALKTALPSLISFKSADVFAAVCKGE